MAFHDVRFPTGIGFGSVGGPMRKTDVVMLASGYEQRNAVWSNSRRRYNAGYGVKSLDDLHTVIEFFECRTGRLHTFRFKDVTDWKSCDPLQTLADDDQVIGVGDDAEVDFQLKKTYSSGSQTYERTITKPVSGTVVVAVNGSPVTPDSIDYATGIVTLSSAPTTGHSVTAGFEFDVPVRFDTDNLDIDFQSFRAGNIQNIPLIEVLS